ncbi:hexosaminidase D-like [Arctopsyche grandis]|uniref:hexosaminidase D-like n=1 Tax=Arctopsyche grandis TaxID=121162 RepID=UPI00406D8354
MDPLTLGSHRLIHLDLKGAPPKISYIEKLFPILRDWGATGILLEWEDTFPYMKDLKPLGGLSESSFATGAPYTFVEARQILDIAAECGLSVIPLVQTLGHMEFVLKYPEWSGLRELENFPSSMCPSQPEALPLVRNMLRQVIALHRPSELQYIHIGADEVWHMGLCVNCSRRASESKYGKAVLFLEHITAIARFLKETHPHIKVIMWDDMLRNLETNILQEYEMGSLVEPMVWHYNAREHFQLGPPLWDKFSCVFPRIWAASAFKGATGSCQLLPVIKHHVSNHEAWLSEIEQHGSKIQKFVGIAFTGWSRYDHYATLCELLPVSLPSLMACLKVWFGNGHYHGSSLVRRNHSTLMQETEFPGWQIFGGVTAFLNIRDRYRFIAFGDQVQTWLNPWQVQNRYTNPMQIQSLIPNVNELLNELHSLELYMRNNLDQIFFKSTVDEWIGSNISPIKCHLQQIKSDTEFQLSLGCCIKGIKKLQ